VKKRMAAIVLAASVAALGAGVAMAHDKDDHFDRFDRDGRDGFSFAFVGDGPYGVAAEPMWENIIDEVNHDRDVRFVMHAGDVKKGSERCDDAVLQRRFDQFQHFRKAFILTPGDNDWTDCHRANNGAYNPLERLGFMRELFFPHPRRSTGGYPIRVWTEADVPGFAPFVENVMFERGGVVFGTLHVIGSNNDLKPWDGIGNTGVTPEQQAEFDAREAANLAWLDRIFDTAEAENAAGVFVMIQANPNFELPEGDPGRNGFEPFLARLHDRAVAFGKPVVLGHGDSHEFFVDKPFDTDNFEDDNGHRVPTFTRVECFGSQRNHWVKVHVDPSSPAVFTFEQRLVTANLP
jgi:hypothetical protein